MYDFDGADGVDTTVAPAPSRALTALELPRWLGEYAASRTLDGVLQLAPGLDLADVGRGRPVLVLPGFAANDVMTGRLRSHLRRRGFAVHGWGLGRNIGLTDALVDGLTARFEEVAGRYDQPVAVVGWSFGGLLARRLAHEYPEQVRQVVCLGSPWRAEGERTRATVMFERSRRRHGISTRAQELVDRLREPLPVPLTAVWSRTDGIVPWRGCRVDGVDGADGTALSPAAENVEVVSSHVGLVANPLPLAVVTDRLAHGVGDDGTWRPFSWRALLPGAVRGVAA